MLRWCQTFIIFVSCCLTLEAFGDFISFSPSLIQINNRLNYFSSQANFDGSGGSQRLPEGNSYKLLELQTTGRYVVGPDWALLFGIQNSEATSQTGVFKRTNNSLNQIRAGIQYYFPLNRVELVPELLLIHSLDGPATSSDFVPNNEGVFEFIGRSKFQKTYSKYYLFGNGGINYRGSGRSGLFLYGAGLGSYLGSWSLTAEIDGFLTFIADRDKGKSNTNQDDRTGYQNRVAGGSKKFYSYDPSETNLNLTAAYSFTKKMTVGGHLGTLLFGTNTASGISFGLDFNFSFGGAKDPLDVSSPREKRLRTRAMERRQRRPPPPPSDAVTSRSTREQVGEDPDLPIDPAFDDAETLQNFQGEQESQIDQSFFQNQPVKRRQNRQRSGLRPQPPQINRPRSRTELPAFEEDPSLQEQLDETEMKIELKQRKSSQK